MTLQILIHQRNQKKGEIAWWTRSRPREYLPGLEKDNPSLVTFLVGHGISRSPQRSLRDRYGDCMGSHRELKEKLFLKGIRIIICSSYLFRERFKPDVSWIFNIGFLMFVYFLLLSKYRVHTRSHEKAANSSLEKPCSPVILNDGGVELSALKEDLTVRDRSQQN